MSCNVTLYGDDITTSVTSFMKLKAKVKWDGLGWSGGGEVQDFDGGGRLEREKVG